MAKKILVVDDEPELLNLVKYVFEKEGFEIRTCDNGRLAIDEIAKFQPDLLILDVMLPGIDGYSLQLKISEDPALKNLPIVVLTALEPSKTLFQKFPQVSAFLTKPFKNEDLLETVRAALAKASKT